MVSLSNNSNKKGSLASNRSEKPRSSLQSRQVPIKCQSNDIEPSLSFQQTESQLDLGCGERRHCFIDPKSTILLESTGYNRVPLRKVGAMAAIAHVSMAPILRLLLCLTIHRMRSALISCSPVWYPSILQPQIGWRQRLCALRYSILEDPDSGCFPHFRSV